MKTLLKDLPEHKERIENNHFLKEDLSMAIMNTENISITKIQSDFITESVMELITDFVNENYEWKGIKA